MQPRLILLCLAIALFASLPAHARAADKLTLLLDWFVNPNHAPIVIAREKGYFADEGLEVEIVPPADPADPPKLVAAGRAELAVSYQPQLHLQVHEGLPLRRVGTLVATPLNCMAVLADGPIRTPADLRGKRIGFSLAGIEDALLGAMAKRHGLERKDYELVNVNWSLAPALMSGQVDAVIGAFRNFELNIMDLAGRKGRCFYPEEEGVPAYDELIYVAHAERMDAAKLRRFLTATERAVQFIVNHPDESWRLFAATSKELDDELNRRAWRDTLPRLALRPAALDTGRYQRMERFMREAGLVDSILPVERIAIELPR